MILLHKYNMLLNLDVTLIRHLLRVAFFSFQNQLYFLRVLLIKCKMFPYNLFHDIKYVCLSNPQIANIEYPQGICSPIFAVEEFSVLFARPSIFLIKDSMSV